MKIDGSVLEEKSSFKMLGFYFSFKLCLLFSKKIGALIRSMKVLSSEAALYLYESIYLPIYFSFLSSFLFLSCYAMSCSGCSVLRGVNPSLKKTNGFSLHTKYWSKIRWKTGIFWLTRKPKWKEHKTHANRNIKNTCLDCTNTTFDLKRKFNSTELQYIGQWYQITKMSSSPL